MAGIVKKKPVDSSSTGQANNPKHLVAPRQRGIPTRVYKDCDRQFDGNRNLRPASRIQLSSSESLENKDHNSDAKLDNAEAKTGSTSLRSLSDVSSPTASAHKMNSVKLIAECDDRSQAISCGSTLARNQDISKPVNQVKTSLLSTYNHAKLRPMTKPTAELSSPLHTAHVTDVSHNSFKSPKRFIGNRNCLNKNKNKVSSSDETCVLKSTEELLCLKGASGKEISVSADHIAVRDEHIKSMTAGLLNANEVFVSDPSVISEPTVTGSCLKEISPEKANERSLERAVENKRLLRGRPGTENHGNRSNLRPQSSGGLSSLRKNQKFRQSASNERPSTSMPRTTTINQPTASDVGCVNSAEVEQERSKRRKSSVGSGSKGSSLKEVSGKLEGPSSSKLHTVGRNQNVVGFSAASKPDKGLKNHVNMTVSGLYRNVAAPSRKAEVRSRDASTKLSSVPKILVSHDPQDLKAVPVSSQQASSDNRQKNEITACRSSPLSCSKPPANDVCPSDNRQAQPILHTVNGDINEDESRRLFHSRQRTADTDESPKVGHYVELENVQSNSCNHYMDGKRRTTSESEGSIVMDGETYQQMKDEFKALKATVLQLQQVLIEGGTVESQISDSNRKSPVKGHCNGDEATPTDEQIHLANVCQENIRLQGRVDELEKLLRKQEQIINSLKQNSAPIDIRMLPGIESAAAEADVELHLRNNFCATEHNTEVPASSLPSCLNLTSESQSKVHLSSTVLSPSSSPQRASCLHTTPVQHFSEKSEQCHTPMSSKSFGSKDREMLCPCNDDEEESVFSCDHNKPVVRSLQGDGKDVILGSANSAELSQTLEICQSKHPRKATHSKLEDEEFGEDYSMFDYNCSVDSDNELCSGICDTPEIISFGVTDYGRGGMPFVSVKHDTTDGKLMNEENGNHKFMANDSRQSAGLVADAALCADVDNIKADASDNYIAGYAQTDQNCNGWLNENGLCDHLGKFDESLSSNSLVSTNCAGEERNMYKRLNSVEFSSQQISEDSDNSAYNLPVRQSVDRSCGDLMSEKTLIKQPPKCQTSSIPCSSVAGEIKSLRPSQTSQSSIAMLSKIPNQSRTLLRMPKCHVSKNREIEERTSDSSVASVPLTGICTASETVHVVPDVTILNQRQLKEPTSSRLPSLRLSRVPKLPTSVSK